MPRPNSWTSKAHQFSTRSPSFHSFTIRYKAKYHTSKSRMHVLPLSTRRKSHVWLAINSGIHGARQSWRIPLTIWSTVVTICNAWLHIIAFRARTQTHKYTLWKSADFINVMICYIWFSLSLKVDIYRQFTFLEVVGLKFACHLNGHISCIQSYECL